MTLMSQFGRATAAPLIVCFALLVPGSADASPYPLENVLSKDDAAKFAKLKIHTSSDLLERGAKKAARKSLAKATGIKRSQIDNWTKMCDLFRIGGVGPEMAKLFGLSKVNTIAQLKRQKAAALHAKMVAANTKAQVTQNPPTQQQVAHWIKAAKQLKIVLR